MDDEASVLPATGCSYPCNWAEAGGLSPRSEVNRNPEAVSQLRCWQHGTEQESEAGGAPMHALSLFARVCLAPQRPRSPCLENSHFSFSMLSQFLLMSLSWQKNQQHSMLTLASGMRTYLAAQHNSLPAAGSVSDSWLRLLILALFAPLLLQKQNKAEKVKQGGRAPASVRKGRAAPEETTGSSLAMTMCAL